MVQSYPENLSRIILTLTCSPIWNHRLRMKFSSIQGSSSPILKKWRLALVHGDYQIGSREDVPEGGLAISTLLGNGGTSIGLTRSGTLETSALSSASHSSVGGSRGTGSGGSVLVGERIKVLERHLESEIRKSRRKNIKRSATETSWSR